MSERTEQSNIEIEPLGESNASAWAALFDACESGCFCRYWHFEGTKNEWLERSARASDANRLEQLAGVQVGALEARGLVATRQGRAIGWIKLAPRACMRKLLVQGAYRAVDLGDDSGIWSIGCFLVHPDERGRGIARALVGAADPWLRKWGARAIEAYPRRAEYRLHPEEAWMGPERIFVDAGFARIHDVSPYPVYRKTL